jgi:acetyl esterase/lipase
MTDLKYAWLSKIDPVWAPIQEECDSRFNVFWALSPSKYQEAWKLNPLVMPEGTPMDLEVTFKTITFRDGCKAEIKIYKNLEKLKAMGEKGKQAPWMLVAHGGGWMMGDHAVEEGVSRYTAKETGAVVISVDYRL